MVTRSTIVTAAVAAAAAMAATGITYASAATSVQALAASAVQQAAPVSALEGGDAGKGNEGKGEEGRRGGRHEDRGYGEERGHRHHREGRIHINERTYSARPGGCVTVISGLGSTSLNIRNDSHRSIEVFRGVTCDNGAPIATVGPWSSSDGVHPGRVKGGLCVENGVVGSFRVIEHHHFRGHDDEDEGYSEDW
ncbi:hypothetical protein [Streptomyces sp. PTD5-9]|uniref:hypothetical protein n=1 Tax=Streptomyces sp. PTD5-9 TaxID=3120150 RepID=UPI00300B4890